MKQRTDRAEAGMPVLAALAGLLDEAGLGVVQLDACGRITTANDSAQGLLREGGGLGVEGGFLRARLPDHDAALQGLIARALPRIHGQCASGSMMLRPSAIAPAFAVHVGPVKDADAQFLPCHRVAALVLIIGQRYRTWVDPVLIEAEMGLTPMESKVVALLASGRTVRDIAADLGRSENTVRWHMQHAFEKTGTGRQADLVRQALLLGGPAAPGPTAE